MGNTASATTGYMLRTAAVSKYMSLSKTQVLEIRDACAALANKNHSISRRFFHIAVGKARIKSLPDGDILDLLFTMWDKTGADRVPALPFVVGVSPLACGNESFAAVLRFALDVMDQDETEQVNADQLVSLLLGMNKMASFFGDHVLSSNQIYKIVDSVFETITLISHDSDSLSHKECIQLITQEPLVKQFLTTNSFKSGPHARVSFALQDPPFARTRLEEESLLSTDVSSVVLTPLARLPPLNWTASETTSYTGPQPNDEELQIEVQVA